MPLFGNKKKSNRLPKEKLEDATELTRFAIAALNDCNEDLAAQRIKEALKVLGK